MVTQPLEKPVSETPIAKVTTTPASATDTLITLKKSGKVLMLPKGLSSKQIDKLDKFLSQNKTPAATASLMQPNAEMCGWHTTYGWEYEDQYQSVAGKALGISNDLNIISLQDAKNIYGFSLVAVNGFSNIDSAENAGFEASNIMVAYLNPTTALAILQSNPNQYPKCGYYEIDEPLKNNFSYIDTKRLEDLISSWNTGAKVMLTDYHWPSPTICDGNMDWGARLDYFQGSNYYIMCDNYGTPPDICGSPCDFGDEYSNYYNPAHVISNWVLNQSVQTSNWDCCFKLANGSDQNIKQIWLWAGSGDTTAIKTFCLYAWNNGWLSRLRKEILITWKCNSPDPCQSCIWGSSNSNWIISSYIYTGNDQYVP